MGLSSTHEGYPLSTSQRTRPRGRLLVEMNYLALKKAIRAMSVTFLTRPLSIHCQQPHYIWFYSIRSSLVVRMHPHWPRTLWNQVQTHQNWNSFFYCSSSCSFVCVCTHVCVCVHMCVMGIHIPIYAHVEARDRGSVSPSIVSHLSFLR